MSNLEQIIRPFQNGDVFTARVIVPTQQPSSVPPADVDLIFGGPSSSNYVAFTLSGLVGGKVVYNEKSRVTQKVRITNPTDASQYVDVERIQKLVLQSTDGNEIHFNLNN